MSNIQYLFLGEADEIEIDDPVFNGKNMTNRVLVQESGQKKIYYCPCYMRIKIKNFAQMNMEDLQACVNTAVILTVNIRGVPLFLKEYIKSLMILRFNRDEALVLSPKNTEVTIKENGVGVFTFTVRKLINTGLDPHIFYSPFQIINLIMSITIQSVEITKSKIQQALKQAKDELSRMEEDYEREKEKVDKINKEQNKKDFKNKSRSLEEIKNKIQAYKEGIIDIRGKKTIITHFNLMDCPLNWPKNSPSYHIEESRVRNLKISYTDQGSFGNYDMAEKLLNVEYSNRNVPSHMSSKDKLVAMEEANFAKISQFQFAHFIIPLYKFPVVSIFTIFLPLWLLGIINLGIFFQEPGLADRIGSLAGLMIAFVALIPVIRDELPPSPTMTLVQILVYVQTLTTLFCLVQSLSIRDDEEYAITWYQNVFFLASVLIQILQVMIIGFLMLRYKCYWVNQYNQATTDVKQMKFAYKEWQNLECDKHFQRKIDSREIKVQKLSKIFIKKQNKNA